MKKGTKHFSKERLAEVLRGLVLTEKATAASEYDAYAFKASSCASKNEIAAAVSSFFNVTVLSVNTLCVKPKNRRFKNVAGVVPGWKKALVRLKKGDVLGNMGSAK